MKNSTIKKSDLKKLLLVNDHTIDSYVKQGVIPIPSYPTYPETEMLYDRDSIYKALGVKEITNEPFIELCEAMKILGLKHEKQVHYYAKTGKIPSYRLRNIRGHKFLFLKSELEALMKYSICWNSDFSDNFLKQIFLKAIFDDLMSPDISKNLSTREIDIVKEVIINKKTFDEIGKKFELTSERIRQIFKMTCKKIYYGFKEVSRQLISIDSLLNENAELRNENKILRELTNKHRLLEDISMDVLKTPVKDLDLSERVLKIFQAADIFTIGDIIKHSKSDMLKFRNFGALSISEVETVLSKYNLKFAAEKIFVSPYKSQFSIK